MSRPTPWLLPIVALLGAVIVFGWWAANRPVGGGPDMPAGPLNSISYAPYRPGQSPLARRFPTAAEADADLTLLAPWVHGIRTYAATEGDFDMAALAQKHGLELWQGVWLGPDRAQNKREIDHAIAIARAYPDTVRRVIVGNEVMLRHDLPLQELMDDLDRVRRAVPQPVTYADVWEYWLKFPELAAHVDLVTIHLLPYWEDDPVNIDRAVLRIEGDFAKMMSLFPDKPVAVGEAGWPSRGRWRADAAPSRVNQTRFIRSFLKSATQRGMDYNLIEAFDQDWKSGQEGVVGANWGLWTADRKAKFVPVGDVVENPDWPRDAALGCALALLLLAIGLATPDLVITAQIRLAALSAALGAALGFALVATLPTLYDTAAVLAAAANLGLQALLALLLVRRIAVALSGLDVPARRHAAEATAVLRGFLRLAPPSGWRAGLLDDLSFLFTWSAVVLQLLLLADPRYRDFPIATFAVPVVAVVARFVLWDLTLRGGGRTDVLAGSVLALAALAATLREGPLNHQAQLWCGCALLLALPPMLSSLRAPVSPAPVPPRLARPHAEMPDPDPSAVAG